MKAIIVFLLFLLNTSLYAQSPRHLKCLGTEEMYIHKNKIGGPYSKLNQDIISELIKLQSTIHLKSEYLNRICNKKFSSFELLKLELTKGDLFYTVEDPENKQEYYIAKNQLKSVRKKVRKIFLHFLSNLQGQQKNPHCLYQQFPQLREVFEKLRFTLKEDGFNKIFNNIKNYNKIFTKLERLLLSNECNTKKQ